MILVANWIGLLPGVGTIGIAHVDPETGHEAMIPLVRPASADLNFTLGLAIVSFVMFVYWGIKANGAGGYVKELMGEPLYMAPLMLPINLISEFSRLISLSMRLFGNVFAGEVLLATMIALAPILVPAVFLGLEALFGFVQALVFALLAMTYIGTAIAEHHAGGDHAADNGHATDHPPAAEAAAS
jgi:F-type H+-transporting ATPase subunit a